MDVTGQKVMKLLHRQRRRLRAIRAMESGAVFAIVGGAMAVVVECVWLVASAFGVSAGWLDSVSLWAIAGAFLAGGFVVGALVASCRRISVGEVAMLVDRRAALRERLTTAAELIASDQCQSSVAQVVCAQAVREYSARQTRPIRLWRRTRATAAALCLVVMLCATVAMFGHSRTRAATVAGRAAARRMLSESKRGRAGLISELRRSMADVPSGSPRSERLGAAVDAIEVGDSEALAEALSRLEEAGVDLAKLLPQGSGQRDSEGEPFDSPPGLSAGRERSEPKETHAAKDKAPGRFVRVYRSEYAAAAPSGEAPQAGSPVPSYASYDDAWTRAQEQAAARINSRQTPGRYRELIRAFFELD